MEGDPALVVRLVDAGTMLHQESHHVNIVIYACLKEGREREKGCKASVSSKESDLPCVSKYVCVYAYMHMIFCRVYAIVKACMERALHCT